MTLELTPPWHPVPPLPKYPATIFDCDGTLVDTSSIVHHVLTKPKNFDAFHYGSLFCPGIDWVLEEVDYHRRAGNFILVVTAREERWRTLTENWLEHNGVPFHELHMRPTGDFRPDVEIKSEILDRLLPRFDIRHAYDDNPSIIGLWKARGIPHTVVPGWAG